jgi:hypothetical protein
MTKKQWLLAIVLVDFSALTAYAVYQIGYSGFVEALTANIGTITAMVDLTIALSLIAVWMWNDAKARGISALPYLGLTLVLGSVGPLLYLLRTSRRAEVASAPARLAAGGAR